MKADSDEIRAVACRFCGAQPGQPCFHYSRINRERVDCPPHATRIERANGMLQERVNQNES